MYKLKEVAKRGSALVAAASLLAGISASALPALASADALNPLIERSLTLSSSSPGWSYLDGSGNSLYAPPNSGANGQKTGNTFSFKTSTASALVKGFTFQYCTYAAGDCTAPGDNGYNTTNGVGNYTRNPNSTSTSDLNVTLGTGTGNTPAEITQTNWDNTISPTATVSPRASHTPLADNSEGNFVVLVGGAYSGGWSMDAATLESKAGGGSVGSGDFTGAKNYIKLTNSTGQTITAGQAVQIIIFGTNTNYITNPGSSWFFVRVNDYNNTDLAGTHIVDGGVTVANVMNQSISIQTKVLETMSFSVGVHDPDTDAITADYTTNTGIGTHGMCDPVLTRDNPGATPVAYSATPENVLKLGNPTSEYSLETNRAWDVNSYWRLSSNSSGGATVYYTGHTLTNTENDQILPLSDSGTGTASQTGTEQFGLAIAHANDSGNGGSVANYFPVGDSYDSAFNTLVSGQPAKYHAPRLWPLTATAPYGGGNGTIANAGTAKFSFNPNADTYAIPIASENTDVVDCVTAKMRYIGNIAATTPAGIYTTKVNYVASPQY